MRGRAPSSKSEASTTAATSTGATQERRTDLGSRLDHYYRLIHKVLLSRQDPITGLMPASTAVNAHGNYTDAWVRDNVYSILAVWGLALAYRKVDWDRGRTYELEQSVVKVMRGVLFAMMRQAEKVERFKHTLAPLDALHAKYDTRTGDTVVGDDEWGHLQIDATSIWLLMLAQMTASGLSIVYTIDEVNFVQNLVYYIGRAYRTPDYGIWERGNKINHGKPELNASSIGMAKAAMEALSGLDLFGVRGSQASVLHVLSDEVARSRITLESLLPWESSSKEVDAALLSIVGFPAFAVEDAELAERTRDRVVEQLQGNYGCKRFLRDGHQTAIEDVTRLYYDPWELKQFEHIECEWPLFFVYLMLDALFRGDEEAAAAYRARLEKVLVDAPILPSEGGGGGGALRLLPELFVVPAHAIDAERLAPGSQERAPNANVPLVWAQSLYYLALMIDEGLLELGEVDPLGRRLRLGSSREPVVQVALLAEDVSLQLELEAEGVSTQTPQQIEPIQVRRAGELAAAYNHIGRNDKLALTGRPVRRLRSLTTSKVFLIRGQLMVFLPSFLDPQKFYLMLDRDFLVAQIKSELAYIQRHWRQAGRPTITLLLTRTLMETGSEALIDLILSMKMGDCGGVHVRLGRIGELRQTSGLERIDYLHDFQFSQDPVRDAQPERFILTATPDKCISLSRADARRIECADDALPLASRLWSSENLYEQIEVLQALLRLKGPDFSPIMIAGTSPSGEGPGVTDLTPPLSGGERSTPAGTQPLTIVDLIEDVYAQASRGAAGRPYWSVLRRAAGLRDKTDTALSDAVTDILVRQKQITVGASYSDASVISSPLQPAEIREKIRDFCGPDVRERMLTQEVLIYFGLLIKSEPQLFRGVMTLRIGYLILLLTSELAQELQAGLSPQSLLQNGGIMTETDAYEYLMELSPSEIQRRLRDILADAPAAATPSPFQAEDRGEVHGGWLRYRHREGTLNRVPPGFYPAVWNLLRHCKGLVIGDKQERRNRLESRLILGEMTAGERNFALWIELLLNKLDAAKYRQINIEAMMALAGYARRNPEFAVDDYLVLDTVIATAVRLAWQDRRPDTPFDRTSALTSFYETSPKECAAYVERALGA